MRMHSFDEGDARDRRKCKKKARTRLLPHAANGGAERCCAGGDCNARSGESRSPCRSRRAAGVLHPQARAGVAASAQQACGGGGVSLLTGVNIPPPPRRGKRATLLRD
eukprot:1477137-Pleurochrysis_carterae.AAC.1